MSTPFNPYWLEMGAVVPVDIPTLAAFAEELRRVNQENEELRQALARTVMMDQTAHDTPQPAQPSKPWVGLTDEEAYKAIKDWCGQLEDDDEPSALDIFRAAEAKLREQKR